jgi:sulfate adenylyltransferase subunit 1
MPVQYVIRPQTADHPDYRGYAGRLASGVVHVGDDVVVLPAGSRTRVVGIDRAATPGEPGRPDEHDVAFAPQSVVLRLADQLDISRGDLIAAVEDQPRVVREILGTVAVLSERPLRARDRVLVRVGTRNVRGLVTDLVDELSVASLQRDAAPDTLSLNAIGRVRVRLAEAVPLDDYADLRRTGAFLLVDEADGTTLAAGMAELVPAAGEPVLG